MNKLLLFLKSLHKNPTMKKVLILILRTIMILLIFYLVFGILMIINEEKFLYHPDKKNNFYECEGFKDYQRLEVNNTRFYYKNLNFSDRVIIYYSGNGGSACDRSALTNYYEGYQASVIFVEYSGYSEDERSPSLELLKQDVHNIQSFIREKNKKEIFLVGESLGTGVAAYHAYHYEIDIILLLAPFFSTYDLGREKFPYYPISFLEIQNYDSALWLENFSGRIIILHGELDKNIPYTQSVKLYEKLESKDKHLFIFPDAKHNDLYEYFNTQRIIRYAFLNKSRSGKIEEYKYITQ